jgi:hypothetical protein
VRADVDPISTWSSSPGTSFKRLRTEAGMTIWPLELRRLTTATK